MARIGILGGTFNPIHMAHLVVAEEVRESVGLQEVIFMPAGDPPHRRDEEIVDGTLRLEMVELGIQGNPCFRSSDLELRRPGPSFSVDTVAELNRTVDAEGGLHLIVGADMVLQLETWKEPDRLLDSCTLLVPTRPGYDLGQLPSWVADRVRPISVTPLGVSSAGIRERIRQRKSIRYLVPEAVRRVIEEQGLYRS